MELSTMLRRSAEMLDVYKNETCTKRKYSAALRIINENKREVIVIKERCFNMKT